MGLWMLLWLDIWIDMSIGIRLILSTGYTSSFDEKVNAKS